MLDLSVLCEKEQSRVACREVAGCMNETDAACRCTRCLLHPLQRLLPKHVGSWWTFLFVATAVVLLLWVDSFPKLIFVFHVRKEMFSLHTLWIWKALTCFKKAEFAFLSFFFFCHRICVVLSNVTSSLTLTCQVGCYISHMSYKCQHCFSNMHVLDM